MGKRRKDSNLTSIEGYKGKNDSNGTQNGRIPIKFRKDAPGECIDATMEKLDSIPGIYQRGEMINQILPQQSGRSAPRQISESNLKGLISNYIEYLRIVAAKAGFEEQSIAPPKDVIAAVHTAGYWPKIPYLRAITNHPIVRKNGSIRSRPGYDPKTQVFSTHSGDLKIKPFSQEDAHRARAQLLELVDEFPFVDIGDDVWLGSVLTPLVRPWCGPSPMFIVTSSTPSAGKGRLVDISSIISCGGEGIEGGAIPPNNEEWQKCLVSWGLACPEIIYFDNVFSGSIIGSPVLDMALTKDRFSGRILGHSKVVETELLATWMVSGNNISTMGDTSRRALICRIEPLIEYPECREFRIPNIIKYTKKHRNKYLSLACGIVAGWLASKGPAPTPPLGSFEGWSYAVRGAIQWAGGADISGALASRVFEGDDSASVHRGLLTEWYKSLEVPVTAKELLETCENATDLYNGKLADIVSEFCPGKGPIRFGTVKQLSFKLRGIENRVRNIENKQGKMVKMAVRRAGNDAPFRWTVMSIE